MSNIRLAGLGLSAVVLWLGACSNGQPYEGQDGGTGGSGHAGASGTGGKGTGGAATGAGTGGTIGTAGTGGVLGAGGNLAGGSGGPATAAGGTAGTATGGPASGGAGGASSGSGGTTSSGSGGTTTPPVIITSTGPLGVATVGVAYASTIKADGGVKPYTFSLVGAPPVLDWLSIDASTGVLSGTPAMATTSPAGFSVAVHDTRSSTSPDSTAMAAYTLTVNSCKEGVQVDCSGVLSGGGACGFGKSTCMNGMSGPCVATTPSTDIARCGAACGSCDVTAANGCAAGKCKCGATDPCLSGATCCGAGSTATCVNTAITVDNCGQCGRACDRALADSCSAGICRCGASAACNNGQTCCGTGASVACVNVQQDLGNCGQCGKACDRTLADSCSGGACRCGTGPACSAGQTCCGGTCFDLAHNVDHCLACGTACDRNKADSCNNGCRCGSGAACGTGQTCCGGSCVDTSTNTSNCGGCGKVCPTGTNACLTGTCSCGSHVGACGSGDTCCSDNCYNLSSAGSSFNCGMCGHSCLGDACNNGKCQATPVSGAAAAPFNYPPDNETGITFGGHTYTWGYATAPDGNYDAAIFKDGSTTPLCIWATYSASNEEDAFHGMAADSNFIYGLLTGGPLGLFKCPIGGGPGVTIFEDPSAYTSNGLVDNGTALYWAETINNTTQIYRIVK